MPSRPLVLVSSLALLSGVAFAEDAGGRNMVTSSGGVVEVKPGGLQGAGRQVFIQGLLDLDAVTMANYEDGNTGLSDHRSEGWIRADMGTRVELDERIEVAVTLGYNGVAGDSRATDPTSPTSTPPNGTTGNAVVNDAYVKLKDFLGYRELGAWLGRQPIAWSLRKDHAAFLFDSRANNPAITGWDAARAQFNLDTIDISPYLVKLPDASSLFGLVVDWKPENVGDNRIFVTGSYNFETSTVLKSSALRASNLRTAYAGLDLDLGDFELFGEFAIQRGDAGGGVDFGGYAMSGGLDWHLPGDLVFGIQGDYLSGDDDPTDTTNHAFINNWEGMSDTYIAESEKYGELTRLLDGNLIDGKLKLEYALDDRKRVRIKSVYGNYRIPKPPAGGSNKFGQEFDLSLSWDYTYNATFTLLGGLFFPGDGYKDVSPSVEPGTDLIYIGGINLAVKF